VISCKTVQEYFIAVVGIESGVRGSEVVKALFYKSEGCGFETRLGELSFLILPAAVGHGVYSVSNRNEYQKQKNNVYGGRARDWSGLG
jgi:hypothetical protein